MSKATQEAERIVDMYWDDFCPKDHFPNNNYCECNSLTQIQAIKCALIHVEGIIDEIQDMDWDFSTRIAAERIEYWNEVLTILNNK